MKHLQKHFSASLIALAALLAAPMAASAATAPSLGAASSFAVLSGGGPLDVVKTVTCTDSTVVGDVGGPFAAASPTRCTFFGQTAPATNAAAAQAQDALASAYTAARLLPCPTSNVLLSTIGTTTLSPGVYCTGAALTASGTLTLDAGGNPNAVWVFQVGTSATGALSGTDFTVTMTGGGQACNVFWVPSADVTFVTSAMKGNILAGNPLPAGGSITLTGGTLAGRALANTAVTMTGASVIGCSSLPGPDGKPPVCKDNDHDGNNDGHHGDKDHEKCNQGVGNGHEDCDPGHSNRHNPWGSNDENGGSKGHPGRKGGNNRHDD